MSFYLKTNYATALKDFKHHQKNWQIFKEICFDVEKRHDNRTFKLLANNMSNVVLLLEDEKLKKRKSLKHPKSYELDKEIVLSSEKPLIIPVIF